MVNVLGTSLAVHDSAPDSDKPTIVCMHAIGHGGSDFASFERTFADRYRIVTIDWPGQGASLRDREPASAQRYTTLLTAVIEALSLRNVILFGNSIGGSCAVRYAAQVPSNVRALILANSAGFDESPGGFLPGLFIGHIEKKMARGAAGDPAFQAWFRDWYADVLVTPAARLQRDAIVASAYEIAPVLREAWSSFKRADADVRALAAKLSMPVFVGWAEQDRIIRWSRSRAAIERIPHVEVHLFPAAHAAFLETPDDFAEAAENFLLRLDTPR